MVVITKQPRRKDPVMPRHSALNKARQATAGALLAATLLTGGVVVHLVDANATVAATSTSGASASPDSSSSGASSSTSNGFGSTSNVANSSASAQSNTGGS